MPKTLCVHGTLTVDELEGRYRGCKDGVAKSHWQMVWLKAKGESTRAVAAVTGYNPDWVRQIIRRYNAQGADGLGDRRQNNGSPLRLSVAEQAALREALSGPAPDGGLWNSHKVALWIETTTGHRVVTQTGCNDLHRQGLSLQTPRPRHPDTTEETIEAFKKNSQRRSRHSKNRLAPSRSGRRTRPDLA